MPKPSARDVVIQAPTAVFSIEAPARSDGYRPIAEALWRFARIISGGASEKEARYVLSAARRLDAANGLFQRIRVELGQVFDASSIAGRRRWIAVVGETELAIIALHRAVEIAAACSDNLTTSVVFPGFVASKRRDLKELRDGYEHIEERALERLKEQPDEKAAAIFAFASLVSDKRLQYDRWSLGIHEEATRVMIETRDYLVAVWHELLARASAAG